MKPVSIRKGRKIPVQAYWDPDTGLLSHQTIMPKEDNSDQAAWSNIMGSYQPEMLIEIMKDDSGEDIGFMPTRGNPTDAGLDFYASEDVLLQPLGTHGDKHRAIVKTGVKVEIPPGMCLLLWDRSGMSAKHGIHRVAGVIDDTYRGEIMVALVNLSNSAYQIKRQEKIIQGILQPMILPSLRRVASLSSTDRGEKGFGSTGR